MTPFDSQKLNRKGTQAMKPESIIVGNSYEVQAGRNKTKVKVVSFDPKKSSWQCETPKGKRISIKDPERFLNEYGAKPQKVTPKRKGAEQITYGKNPPPTMQSEPKHFGPKPLGEMSALAAAHRVLLEEGRPMRVREIAEAVIERGYCVLNGKTPHCTINGGIQKEIATKGDNSRFYWHSRGLFAAR